MRTPLLQKDSREIRKIINEGVNPLYNLTETYFQALIKNTYYDQSWWLFYKFVTKKDLNILEVRSLASELLSKPDKTADNIQDSTALVRLLLILEKMNRIDDLDYEKLETWLEEVERRKWYTPKPQMRTYSSEFHGFFAAVDSLRDKNPEIEKIFRSQISGQTIRPLLYTLFGLSFSDLNEVQEEIRSVINRIAVNYSGIIHDFIIRSQDIEFFAIYLYLLAKYNFYNEFERIYLKFEELISAEIISADWIRRVIETVRDIQLGYIEDDIITVSPCEVSIAHPKFLILSLMALYEAGYDRVAIMPAKYQKLAQRFREKGLVGLPKDSKLLKYYEIFFYTTCGLIFLLGSILGYLLGNTLLGAILGSFVDIILFILDKKYIEPEIFDPEKDLEG